MTIGIVVHAALTLIVAMSVIAMIYHEARGNP